MIMPELVERKRRCKQLVGTVVRDKMDKTVVVMTSRKVQHPRYKKFHIRLKKYKAHNHENQSRYGDVVLIEECRRLSKEKRWVVKKILKRAMGVGKDVVVDEISDVKKL